MNPFRTDARVDDLQAKIVTLNKKNTQLSRFYKYAVLSLFITISGIAGFALRFWSEEGRPTRKEVAEAIFAAAHYERHHSLPKTLVFGQGVVGTIHTPVSWVTGDVWLFEARAGDFVEFFVAGADYADLRLELQNSLGDFMATSTSYKNQERILRYRFHKSGQYKIEVFEPPDHEFHLPVSYELSATLVETN